MIEPQRQQAQDVLQVAGAVTSSLAQGNRPGGRWDGEGEVAAVSVSRQGERVEAVLQVACASVCSHAQGDGPCAGKGCMQATKPAFLMGDHSYLKKPRTAGATCRMAASGFDRATWFCAGAARQRRAVTEEGGLRAVRGEERGRGTGGTRSLLPPTHLRAVGTFTINPTPSAQTLSTKCHTHAPITSQAIADSAGMITTKPTPRAQTLCPRFHAHLPA